MRRRLIYLIGPPGAGKSTLMAALTRHLDRVPTISGRMPRDRLLHDGHEVGVELGRRRESFSGTDALGMAIHPTAVTWIGHASLDRLVLAEGQRLATLGFLGAALDRGFHVDLVLLDPPSWVVEQRRAARGSAQSEAWLKGATTRVHRLAAHAELLAGVTLTRIVSINVPEPLADDLAEHLDLVEAMHLARPATAHPAR